LEKGKPNIKAVKVVVAPAEECPKLSCGGKGTGGGANVKGQKGADFAR